MEEDVVHVQESSGSEHHFRQCWTHLKIQQVADEAEMERRVEVGRNSGPLDQGFSIFCQASPPEIRIQKVLDGT